MRDIFIRDPIPEFELDPSQCLQLLKPLYGLCESGDLWHRTLDEHHKRILGMTPMKFYPALYTWIKEGSVRGLSGTYVDDLLRADTKEFEENSAQTNKKFDMANKKAIPCSFTGFRLSKSSTGDILMDQKDYLQKSKPLPEDCSYA